MLDGRVKTLHPRTARRHTRPARFPRALGRDQGAGIEPIDLVVVNLYPFARAVAKSDCTLAEAIENIDVGGPSMLRAGAKNYAGVAVVTDPSDYSKAARGDGETRRGLERGHALRSGEKGVRP